jgi:hypothetical protein
MSDFAQIRFLPNRPLLRELSADRLNTILQEIKRNKPKGERGITVRQDGTGTYIGLAASLPRGGGTSTPATTHPFQITSFADPESDQESPSYLATVRPGAINQIISASHFDGADLAQISIDTDTLTYVVLTATSNGKEITSATISTQTEAPETQTPTLFALPTEMKYTLGLVYNDNAHQIITNNINVSGKIVYTKDRATAAQPGQLPFEIWYVWQ